MNGHEITQYLYKKKKKQKPTEFRLEFKLDEQEIEAFRRNIRSNLNGILPIVISIDKDSHYEVKVVKRGRGIKALNSKSTAITSYIARRISFNYIPAVRTQKQSLDIIYPLLTDELSVLESNPKYSKALKTISRLEKPILKELSQKVKERLSEFLPDIKKVEIKISDDPSERLNSPSDFEVIVNDGTATNIEYKGDGVKSLAALGLLKSRVSRTDASIIAIEEPESHLHPGAMLQLKEIIRSLENENQIVLTTHNPYFIYEDKIDSNIIVDGKKSHQGNEH